MLLVASRLDGIEFVSKVGGAAGADGIETDCAEAAVPERTDAGLSADPLLGRGVGATGVALYSGAVQRHGFLVENTTGNRERRRQWCVRKRGNVSFIDGGNWLTVKRRQLKGKIL